MVIAAKLTRLTHKIALQLHVFQRAILFAVLAPGGQSGNFWMHPRTQTIPLVISVYFQSLFHIVWCISPFSCTSGHGVRPIYDSFLRHDHIHENILNKQSWTADQG